MCLRRYGKGYNGHSKRLLNEVPWLSTLVAAVVCNVNAGCWAIYGQIMAGISAGVTLANGGTLGDALKGYAIGAVTAQIGGAIGGELTGSLVKAFGESAGAYAAQAVGAVISGGIASKASGGKFADGVKGAVVGLAIRGAVSGIRGIITGGEKKAEPTPQIDVPEPDIPDVPVGDVEQPAMPGEPTRDFSAPTEAPYSRTLVVEEVVVTGTAPGCNYCYDGFLQGVNTGLQLSVSYGGVEPDGIYELTSSGLAIPAFLTGVSLCVVSLGPCVQALEIALGVADAIEVLYGKGPKMDHINNHSKTEVVREVEIPRLKSRGSIIRELAD